MDRYAVKLAGNNVVVDIDKLYQEDTDNAQWQHAVVDAAVTPPSHHRTACPARTVSAGASS